jgi:hypothetical protein
MRRLAQGLFAALVAVALVGGSSASAASAPATPGSTQFTSSTITLDSSTGQHLHLHVYVDRFSYGDYRPGGASLQVGVSKGNEHHNWEFPADDPDFVADPVSGDVVIKDSRHNLHHFAVINLTAHPTGPTTSHTCENGDSYTLRPERLAGTIYLDTGVRAASTWGHVGSKRATTVFHGRSELEYQYGNPADGCEHYSGTFHPCRARVSWLSPLGNGAGAVEGGSTNKAAGGTTGYFDWQRTVNLGHTSVARDDVVMVKVPPPLLTTGDHSATLKVRTGKLKLVTGTAVLRSTKPAQTEPGCGSTPTGRYRSWTGSFHSGRQPLKVHLALGGTVSMPDRTHGAEFDQLKGAAA